jgi:hypothetical protein
MKQESNWKTTGEMFPVMKFDLENRLVYSNVAALPLLKEWKCRINEKLPSELVSRYPEIFHASFGRLDQDISIQCNDLMIHFTLVPFPEAGYIGMYGHRIEPVDSYVQKAELKTSTNR